MVYDLIKKMGKDILKPRNLMNPFVLQQRLAEVFSEEEIRRSYVLASAHMYFGVLSEASELQTTQDFLADCYP